MLYRHFGAEPCRGGGEQEAIIDRGRRPDFAPPAMEADAGQIALQIYAASLSAGRFRCMAAF